jgi:hypothetical protein
MEMEMEMEMKMKKNSSSKKHVHFNLPNTIGIKIYDHIFDRLIRFEWMPSLCLSSLERFYPKKIRFYQKYYPTIMNERVICRDKDLMIDLDIPLGEQGIEQGDILEIYPVDRRLGGVFTSI